MKHPFAALGAFAGLCVFFAITVSSASSSMPARIVHQTEESYIVRMDVDDHYAVWQEVGTTKAQNTLFFVNYRNGRHGEIRTNKRPFGPALAGGAVVYGAGNIAKNVDVFIHDLNSNTTTLLHKEIPWIVEPAVQVAESSNGEKRFQATWERSYDDNGNGLAIYLYEGSSIGKGNFKVVADGPVFRKNDIPKQYHKFVHNEYPEISEDSIVFQNNEYGTPNVYRHNFVTGEYVRVSPSQFVQERPDISGPYTVWEESEKGFAVSDESAIFVHDIRDGSVKKINRERGYHYQVQIRGRYVVYGAKRESGPAMTASFLFDLGATALKALGLSQAELLSGSSTPSVRVYDLEENIEYPAQKCFPGGIFAYVPTDEGTFAAQRFSSSSSRLLFATWDQIKSGCR